MTFFGNECNFLPLEQFQRKYEKKVKELLKNIKTFKLRKILKFATKKYAKIISIFLLEDEYCGPNLIL